MTGVPLENGEDMQILKYEKGQHYWQHRDAFEDDLLLQKDGFQRTVTCLMYLSDPESGGETNFPPGIPTQDFKEQHQNDMLSTCASQYAAYSVKPKRGDALVFYTQDVSNQHVDVVSFPVHMSYGRSGAKGAPFRRHTRVRVKRPSRMPVTRQVQPTRHAPRG